MGEREAASGEREGYERPKTSEAEDSLRGRGYRASVSSAAMTAQRP